MNNIFPAIPDYINDPIVFYDAFRGLCLVGIWGDQTESNYWLFTPINGAWVSRRTLTEVEEENLDILRTKRINS